MAQAIPHTQTLSQWAKDNNSDVTYVLREDLPPSSITLNTGKNNDSEMIKITDEGFWVRGVKVPQDDKEAETVYNAFKQWMAWAALQQRR